MSDDFVTRLGLQLQEAAERDVRRSAPARALRGSRRFSPALAGAVALAVVVAAVVAATLWLRGDETPLPAQPRVVATLHVTDNPVQIVDAFGSIWIADNVAGRILRLDPATGAVQATIQVRTGNWLWITPVRGQLWASVDELPLIQRIDPGTNRVVARTPVRTPDGRPFRVGTLWAAGDNVWAVSMLGALRLDPATGRGRVLADAPRDVRWFELGTGKVNCPGMFQRERVVQLADHEITVDGHVAEHLGRVAHRPLDLQPFDRRSLADPDVLPQAVGAEGTTAGDFTIAQ